METWVPPEAFDGCPAKETTARDTPAAAAPPHGTQAGLSSIPTEPSCLWNAMIVPLAGYGLRAVLHNQIESNM